MRNTVPTAYTAVPTGVTVCSGHVRRNQRSRCRNPSGHVHRNVGHDPGITGHVGPEYSARRIEAAQSLPSQRPSRSWRTREDPLESVWDSEVIPLLQTDARLNAVALLEELQRRETGRPDQAVE